MKKNVFSWMPEEVQVEFMKFKRLMADQEILELEVLADQEIKQSEGLADQEIEQSERLADHFPYLSSVKKALSKFRDDLKAVDAVYIETEGDETEGHKTFMKERRAIIRGLLASVIGMLRHHGASTLELEQHFDEKEDANHDGWCVDCLLLEMKLIRLTLQHGLARVGEDEQSVKSRKDTLATILKAARIMAMAYSLAIIRHPLPDSYDKDAVYVTVNLSLYSEALYQMVMNSDDKWMEIIETEHRAREKALTAEMERGVAMASPSPASSEAVDTADGGQPNDGAAAAAAAIDTADGGQPNDSLEAVANKYFNFMLQVKRVHVRREGRQSGEAGESDAESSTKAFDKLNHPIDRQLEEEWHMPRAYTYLITVAVEALLYRQGGDVGSEAERVKYLASCVKGMLVRRREGRSTEIDDFHFRLHDNPLFASWKSEYVSGENVKDMTSKQFSDKLLKPVWFSTIRH